MSAHEDDDYMPRHARRSRFSILDWHWTWVFVSAPVVAFASLAVIVAVAK